MKRKPSLVHAALTTGLAALCGSALYAPQTAQAFCGFYVAGADTNLYANATMVVLMREGTKTVLSMQNNYQGPPEEFALVIPVPEVLSEDQVKVLPHEVFEHVDALGAPRLVEYWEIDPCFETCHDCAFASASGAPTTDSGVDEDDGGVTIEASFEVGEYDVVVLSANDSTGLDTWLRDNNYNIPEGADEVLAPYVAQGTKFFVAKVDPARVTFKGNQAVLSPLRFHYDTDQFSLPVRLGLLNSQGTQDLIVNILASDRYEVANYENVTIPTNIRVHEEVSSTFGGFYESLFSETLEKKPGAVVTEYSWDASTCDPCPTPPLEANDLATLGTDVTLGENDPRFGFPSYTLTRLHYRYTSETLGEDLVFKQAKPIIGGRGTPDQDGKLEKTDAESASFNNFQGRYIILHPWEKPITCEEPQRGYWGGPEGSDVPMTQGSSNAALSGVALDAVTLSALVAEGIPEIAVQADNPLAPLDVRDDSTTGSGGDSGSAGDDNTTQSGGTTVPDATAQAGDAGVTSDNAEGDGEEANVGCSCRVGEKRTTPSLGLASFSALAALWLRRRKSRRATGGDA